MRCALTDEQVVRLAVASPDISAQEPLSRRASSSFGRNSPASLPTRRVFKSIPVISFAHSISLEHGGRNISSITWLSLLAAIWRWFPAVTYSLIECPMVVDACSVGHYRLDARSSLETDQSAMTSAKRFQRSERHDLPRPILLRSLGSPRRL
jgi:hypothetical protein